MESKSINSKKVFIVKNHHEVLLPWYLYYAETHVLPLLLTIDHHADTKQANEELIKEKTDNGNLMNTEVIESIIREINNDMHISAAIQTNIIGKALVISYQGPERPRANEVAVYTSPKEVYRRVFLDKHTMSKPERPFTYPIPMDGIYQADPGCFIGCSKEFDHDNDCEKKQFDQAIETVYLSEKFLIFNDMCPENFNGNEIVVPYILDIDLDYFHSVKSIRPDDPTLFYQLIHNAEFVTIATEPEFIDLKYESISIDHDFFLQNILEHINNATEK